MLKGKLHSIETFGAVDGPGIRTVFFMQGCPARCVYCHNPDSWQVSGGKEVSVEEIIKRACRGKSYYQSDGGVTFSGGEPLLQGKFIAEAIRALKNEGINSAIDTSGTYFDRYTSEAVDACELVLLDIKHTDKEQFEQITGRSQETLFQLIELINKLDKSVWIRQVVLPGYNDNYGYIRELSKFIKIINNVSNVELLGYHNMAEDKYKKMGIEYKLKGLDPMDTVQLEELRNMI